MNVFLRLCLLGLISLIATAWSPNVQASDSEIMKEMSSSFRHVDMSLDGDAADIIELFSYDCSVCYSAEPLREALVTNLPLGAKFKAYAIPTIRAEWHNSAKLFRAAEVNGFDTAIHRPLFDLLHKKKRELQSDADIVAFLKEIGLPDLSADFDSPASRRLGAHVDALWDATQSNRVPTFVIKGKYLVFWGSDVTPAKFVKLVHALYEECLCNNVR